MTIHIHFHDNNLLTISELYISTNVGMIQENHWYWVKRMKDIMKNEVEIEGKNNTKLINFQNKIKSTCRRGNISRWKITIYILIGRSYEDSYWYRFYLFYECFVVSDGRNIDFAVVKNKYNLLLNRIFSRDRI